VLRERPFTALSNLNLSVSCRRGWWWLLGKSSTAGGKSTFMKRCVVGLNRPTRRFQSKFAGRDLARRSPAEALRRRSGRLPLRTYFAACQSRQAAQRYLANVLLRRVGAGPTGPAGDALGRLPRKGNRTSAGLIFGRSSACWHLARPAVAGTLFRRNKRQRVAGWARALAQRPRTCWLAGRGRFASLDPEAADEGSCGLLRRLATEDGPRLGMRAAPARTWRRGAMPTD